MFKFDPETNLFVIILRIMLIYELANFKSDFLGINKMLQLCERILISSFIQIHPFTYSTDIY